MPLTSSDCLQRVEKGHKQVHEHSKVEGDAAPEGHVSRAPVKDGLSCVTADQSKLIPDKCDSLKIKTV